MPPESTTARLAKKLKWTEADLPQSARSGTLAMTAIMDDEVVELTDDDVVTLLDPPSEGPPSQPIPLGKKEKK